MNYSNVNIRKIVALAVLGMLILWVIFYIFTHSILVVKGVGDEEKTVYIQRGEDDIKIENFTLTDNSKTLILPKGFYVIGVSGEDKQSMYEKGLGGASKHEMEVELKPQKTLRSLGPSTFDCARNQKSVDTIVFYPCSDYQGVVETKAGADTEVLINPLAEDATVHEHGLAEAVEKETPPGFALEPYQDGFLSAVSNDNLLQLKPLNNKGRPGQNTLTVEGYQGSLESGLFSAAQDGQNFSVFDKTGKSLLVFDNADQQPGIVDFSEEIGETESDNPYLWVRVASSKDFTFVVISKTLEDIEDHSTAAEDSDHTDHSEIDQRVYIVDNSSKEIVETKEIPSETIIAEVTASPGNTLMLMPVFEGIGGVHLITADSYEIMSLPQRGVKDVCWKDSESFYYSIIAGNQIYERSVPKQASFLVYSNPAGIVDNINCTDGVLSFSSNKTNDDSDELTHYEFSDEILSGTRIENLVPLYIDVGRDTIKVTQVGLKLRVEKIFDGDGNPSTPSKQQSKKSVIERLRDQGADTTGLSFIID